MVDPPASATTLDILFDGRMRVHQPRGGYRFSIDAILLAHRARPHSADTVLDLGTGCGIIPLILCYRHPDISVWGVEIQAALAELACRNCIENRLQDRMTVLNADLRELESLDLPEAVDLIVSNPPYRRQNSGRLNPNVQRAMARHEVSANLNDVLAAARRRLRSGGRFMAIYTADRLLEMLDGMRAAGIEPKFLQMIHSRPHFDAKRVLIEGVKGARSGIHIAPPLMIHDRGGRYSAEVAAMFRP